MAGGRFTDLALSAGVVAAVDTVSADSKLANARAQALGNATATAQRSHRSLSNVIAVSQLNIGPNATIGELESGSATLRGIQEDLNDSTSVASQQASATAAPPASKMKPLTPGSC